MASTGQKKKPASGSASSKKTASKTRNTTPSRSQSKPVSKPVKKERDGLTEGISRDIILITALACAVLLFISLIGFGGSVGEAVRRFIIGLFGLMGYLFPFVLVFAIFFYMANARHSYIGFKMAGLGIIYLFLCPFLQLLFTGFEKGTPIRSYYTQAAADHTGGGLVGGLFVTLFGSAFGTAGAYILTILVLIIGAIILTQKPLVSSFGSRSSRAYRTARDRRQERRRMRKDDPEGFEDDEPADGRIFDLPDLRSEAAKNGPAASVTKTSKTKGRKSGSSDLPAGAAAVSKAAAAQDRAVPESSDTSFRDPSVLSANLKEAIARHSQPKETKEIKTDTDVIPGYSPDDDPVIGPEEETPGKDRSSGYRLPHKPRSSGEEQQENVDAIKSEIAEAQAEEKPYVLPTTDLLTPIKANKGDSDQHLMDTARLLQETFHDFGVNVRVINVSRGPTVTRYELQPEHGVKVSRILSLSDDIKLNLAAADIRIEAPIPGKAAVGIEVPNKETSTVSLREMLETEEFKNFKKPLAFAVGKDIGGQPVITDIAKMPHLLIAGATGSGKSVCINTLIMSILFKSSPEDVKMLMIDPKVVELKIYDGIPHLLIPVVTDVKKASGALNWAVAEMTERYNKFAEFNGVRDIDSYNERVEKINADPAVTEKLKKLPRIVIIVDELADLMMVAPGEVEDAICRLAQLARAAGIHIIIATQRPSVNVVTGLIKANMPSRIALAVTSGIDSRTILDTVGAEKLLGKGDMLFYPQSYPNPQRVQGAYVSDEDISEVVKFLSTQSTGMVYNKAIEESITASVNHSGPSAGGNGDERDEYFWEAGRVIIDKDKASIGMLQRMFKIGFNRAARIMDQLCEAGVVGEEEGTKPRTILMTEEQFENMREQKG